MALAWSDTLIRGMLADWQGSRMTVREPILGFWGRKRSVK